MLMGKVCEQLAQALWQAEGNTAANSANPLARKGISMANMAATTNMYWFY